MTTEEEPQPTFADVGVQPAIVEALAARGIVHPFPIQALTLPVALAHRDIIGQAKTGTGKTLGFGIPLLMGVAGPGEDGHDGSGKPQALIVVPTRELAVQVAGDLEAAATNRSARVLTVYGGRAYEPQVEALKRGVEIVVGTPGRLLDLAQQRHLDLSAAKFVVLDEADEMLDLGFLPDVERIFALAPARRHTMLFSATMPGPVVALARRYMSQPTHIRASEPDDHGRIVKTITQVVYRAHAMDKTELLARILQAQGRGLAIIFARTKRTAAKVADDLTERGFAAAAIHGDLGQGAREQALRAFRHGKVDILVATDVAARGIDVDDVTHVINYQCPEDEKTYIHRIGRTGRAGKTGTAITFVDWDDLHRWALVDKALGLGLPEPVETYSSSDHVYTDLDIPTTVTGRLPRARRTRAGLEAERLEDLGETGKHAHGHLKGGHGGHGKGDHDRPGRRRGSADGEAGTEKAPRQRRRRRRTHSGEGSSVEAGQHSEGRPTASSDAPVAVAAGTSAQPTTAADGGERKPRRRRRRRSGSGAGAEGQPPDRCVQ